MTDTPAKLEDLAAIGIRAIADAAHQHMCACTLWPDNCPYYKPDQWEHGDETDFLAAVIPAIREQIAGEIEATGLKRRTEIAPYISREQLACYRHAATIARGDLS